MLTKHLRRPAVLSILLVALQFPSQGQGRVVINEFMSWSGCNTTSEFIELLNFGPGPMNIGCYIVTNGTYSVTIPPNTILAAGKYYVLSGQDLLSKNCGNTDSAIHVNLNWTTCNCTNVTIPTTGDGFLQNGGNANEKVVLLDPNLNVIDAVSRNTTPSSSVSITTPAIGGGCSSKTFNLSAMSIAYESINNSTGVDNSFARKVDGDCGWVKTTAISAGAPNKTGSTSSASYQFTTLSASECNGSTGSISIGVSASDVNSLFPMNYTLAYDTDENNLFNDADLYSFGIDNSPSTIDISNLAYGRYRITVGSSSGCNLKTYDFYIFNCYGVVLPLKLLYFNYAGTREDQHEFKFRLSEGKTIKSVILEATNGSVFQPVLTVNSPISGNEITVKTPISGNTRYRLRLVDNSGVVSYSQEIKINRPENGRTKYWPNPVKSKINVQLNTMARGSIAYSIVSATGMKVKQASVPLDGGSQVLSLGTDNLNAGIYCLNITGAILKEAVTVRFIKY